MEIINYKILSKKISIQIDNKSFVQNNWILIILVIFPILSLIETKLTLGYLPIFEKQTGFVMYNLNLGLISSKFTLFGVISGIYMYLKLIKSNKKTNKMIFLTIILLDIVQMSVDGARFRLLIFMITLLILNLKLKKEINFKKVIKYIMIIFFVYISGCLLRMGKEINLNNIINNGLSVGGEYKDWLISLNYLNGLKLNNYDIFKSSIVQFFNKNLLAYLGVDFYYLNSLGSANYFANFFHVSQNGIRIGIVGELQYGYGYLGMLIFFIFSLIVSQINIKIKNIEDIDKIIFLSIMTSYNLLTIMGQMNTLFNGIKNVIVSFIILFLINKLTHKNYEKLLTKT